MIRTQRSVLIAVILPILALAALTFYKSRIRMVGSEHVFKIVGYDPRDLISGHYVVYGVEYEAGDVCSGKSGLTYLCLDTGESFSEEPDRSCSKFLRGTCDTGRFAAGIERFYIPDSEAKRLDRKVREGAGSIKVSIDSSGNGVVKDLLIDGVTWSE
ncbi:MAG: GDYXXLXY domain-containing protein [Bdellovibrionota bacterium]